MGGRDFILSEENRSQSQRRLFSRSDWLSDWMSLDSPLHSVGRGRSGDRLPRRRRWGDSLAGKALLASPPFVKVIELVNQHIQIDRDARSTRGTRKRVVSALSHA